MGFPSHRTLRHFLHSFQWFTGKNYLRIADSFRIPADGAPAFSARGITLSSPMANKSVPCIHDRTVTACPECCIGEEVR